MARQKPGQTSTATAQQAQGALHTSSQPYQFEVIPQVCLIADVAHFLRMSESSVHRLLRSGDHALRELKPFDSTRRFAGESLAFEIKRRAVAVSAVASKAS